MIHCVSNTEKECCCDHSVTTTAYFWYIENYFHLCKALSSATYTCHTCVCVQKGKKRTLITNRTRVQHMFSTIA
jgi:hypothetical protein